MEQYHWKKSIESQIFQQKIEEFERPIRKLRQQINGINTGIQQLGKSLREPFEVINDFFTALSTPPSFYDSARVQTIRHQIHELGTAIFKRLDTAFHVMSWELLFLENYLLIEGWSISPDRITPSETRAICQAICEGKNVKSLIIGYIQERIKQDVDTIEQEIIVKWPARKRFFQAAFEAHREQKYELSIPMFLIQLDGVSADLFRQSLYEISRRSDRTVTKQEILKLLAKMKTKEDQMFWFFILQVLLQKDPIREKLPEKKYRKRKNKGTYILNRHAILHGIDLDYDTESNSLSLISRLDYFNGVRDYIDYTIGNSKMDKQQDIDIEELVDFISESLKKIEHLYIDAGMEDTGNE